MFRFAGFEIRPRLWEGSESLLSHDYRRYGFGRIYRVRE